MRRRAAGSRAMIVAVYLLSPSRSGPSKSGEAFDVLVCELFELGRSQAHRSLRAAPW